MLGSGEFSPGFFYTIIHLNFSAIQSVIALAFHVLDPTSKSVNPSHIFIDLSKKLSVNIVCCSYYHYHSVTAIVNISIK